MFRFVVATYLMIVTAAGPAACCCTFARFTARFVPTTTAPAPSCCHSTPPAKESEGGPERRSPNRPDAPGCPCKQAGCSDAVALPSELGEALESSTPDASAHFGSHLATLLDPSGPQAGGSSPFRGGGGTASGPTTDDLLFAFHMLRC